MIGRVSLKIKTSLIADLNPQKTYPLLMRSTEKKKNKRIIYIKRKKITKEVKREELFFPKVVTDGWDGSGVSSESMCHIARLNHPNNGSLGPGICHIGKGRTSGTQVTAL